MNRRETLAVALVSGLSMARVAAAEEETPERPQAEHKPVLANELKDNVRVRLVAARISDRRGQNLIAKFQTNEKEPTTLVIHFPAHSFTTHEQTLRAVIRACVDWDNSDDGGWAPAVVEADFSLPKDGRQPGAYSPLEKCCLVSLRLPHTSNAKRDR